MKTINLLLLFFAFLFFSCSDDDKDDNDNFTLSSSFLKQTVWEGSYIAYKMDKKDYECGVNLFFKSETEVKFIEKQDDFSNEYTVPYKANGKMLSIEINSMSPQLSGDWLLTETKKDKMVLIKNMEDKDYYYVMTLSKIY